MEPHNMQAANDSQERPYTLSSTVLLIIKAAAIAAALVLLASYGTRAVLALMPS